MTEEDIVFSDRQAAGRLLAEAVRKLDLASPVVAALPRGGVIVGYEVARRLKCPLEPLPVRKISAPGNRELAIGALTEEGIAVYNDILVARLKLTQDQIQGGLLQQRLELERQSRMFRGNRPPVDMRGRNVIIVDDGLATGMTALAAVRLYRKCGAAQIVLAVPVAAPQSAKLLKGEVDELICLKTPSEFWAVSQWYSDFGEVGDREVVEVLERARQENVRRAAISIPLFGTELHGELALPEQPCGLVVFAHGRGSNRLSPRNAFTARTLNGVGIGTLLFDLLTPEEAGIRENVFDIPLLSSRVELVIDWLRKKAGIGQLPIALFGASTGAAAALHAAATSNSKLRITAVVSRGGRTDLAEPWLGLVQVPVLLIVGSEDADILAANRNAQKKLKDRSQLEILPGAGHLFEEPGALEAVAHLSADWLLRVFGAVAKVELKQVVP